MDVLSSMANLAGYRAVIEAAEAYQGFFGPQMTAAGAMPPARVLVIGAGVAGLAAIAAARSLGAEVRAFDTRAAAREQVESLGASFLTVELDEHGDGGGGYAKVMSPEFLAAELALFEAQAREVDVIITTALVPGAKAPLLLTKAVVEALKPGSVVVDLAAEQGGNCELTVADARVEHRGVRILGDTDLVSRMASTASRFFANNLVHLLTEMGGGDAFRVDPDSEIVRPALVTHGGEVLPPPPRPAPKATPAVVPAALAASPPGPSPTVGPIPLHPPQPVRRARQTAAAGAGALLLLLAVGSFAPRDFLEHLTVFVLACFVGWQVVWSVTPALHTPLMSVTNAISGIIIIGGMLQIGEGVDLASVLGALAVFFSAINIAGGFLVTQRMLAMFRRREPDSGADPRSRSDGERRRGRRCAMSGTVIRRLPRRSRALHPQPGGALASGDRGARKPPGHGGDGARDPRGLRDLARLRARSERHRRRDAGGRDRARRRTGGGARAAGRDDGHAGAGGGPAQLRGAGRGARRALLVPCAARSRGSRRQRHGADDRPRARAARDLGRGGGGRGDLHRLGRGVGQAARHARRKAAAAAVPPRDQPRTAGRHRPARGAVPGGRGAGGAAVVADHVRAGRACSACTW